MSATQNHIANASTLGRFSKSTNRLTATNSLNGHNSAEFSDYRNNSQTLPRKLEHSRPLHSSTINVSIVNTVPKPLQNTGPAKPARTYNKSLITRSKSFNVHGLNGTNDPSPIYIEKVGGGHHRFNNHANMYKSNPHLNESISQLKSPSIVNLISRSTRDLSSAHRANGSDAVDHYYERYNNYNNNGDTKKSIFLKNLHDRSPELYKVIHEDSSLSSAATPMRNGNLYKYRERESSLGSRGSPVTIINTNNNNSVVAAQVANINNKDAIVRRGSSSTEDYSETFKTTTDKPGAITNTVESFSRKTVPSPDGRSQTRIESHEVKSVTSSHRYHPKYLAAAVDSRPPRGGSTVIEVRNRH